MAVCNLFRQLTKDTGSFLLFSQYTEDLTRSYVQHDSYRVIPSKFVAIDANYSNIKTEYRHPGLSNPNEYVPTFFQNWFENGCTYLRSRASNSVSIAEGKWDPSSFNPKTSSNIFWNLLVDSGLLTINSYDDIIGGSKPEGVSDPFDVISEIKYVGKIDIHSYEEKDGVGYNEVYCYIPNNATEVFHQVIDETSQTNSKNVFRYNDPYIIGCDSDTQNILGILPHNTPSPFDYSPTYLYNFVGNESNDPNGATLQSVDANAMRALYGQATHNTFTFNTIVVLYDVVSKDANGTPNILYKDIPMGIYITGLIDGTGIPQNAVTKYTQARDAYNSGTSYGLRICTRFLSTPNATTINSVSLDVADQYAGFAQAMSKMSESQEQMNIIIQDAVAKTQDIKDHLAAFKNNKTNVPYIRQIGNEYVWFVNGTNTGVHANGRKGADGKNGTILELIEHNGSYYWAVDGHMTNVRAEGLDGQIGPQGPQGIPGRDGITPRISIDSKTKNWIINGVDTGICAEPQKISIRNINGVNYWYVGNQNQNIRADAQDGKTPEIRTADDGFKYWFVDGVNTQVRAEAVDGSSLYVVAENVVVTNGNIYLPNHTSFDWAKDDTILYIGNDVNGIAFKYDIYRVNSYNAATDLWRMAKLGNINAKLTDVISDITIEKNGNNLHTTIVSPNGNKTYVSKDPATELVSHSTLQKKFHYLYDTVYFCGAQSLSRKECWVEIPYAMHVIKNSSSYDVAIRISGRYRNLRGLIDIKTTKLDLPYKTVNSAGKTIDSTYTAFDTRTNNNICINTKYFRLVKGSIQDGRNITTLDGDKFAIKTTPIQSFWSQSRITFEEKSYVIWKNLTRDQLRAINHSYKISQHIGKVHVFVSLEDLYSNQIRDFINNQNQKYSMNIAFMTGQPGILKYDKVDNMWKVNDTHTPVFVRRHQKTVSKMYHKSDVIPARPANTIEEFMALYHPHNMYFWLYGGKPVLNQNGTVKKIMHVGADKSRVVPYWIKSSGWVPNRFYNRLKNKPNIALFNRFKEVYKDGNVEWSELPDSICKYIKVSPLFPKYLSTQSGYAKELYIGNDYTRENLYENWGNLIKRASGVTNKHLATTDYTGKYYVRVAASLGPGQPFDMYEISMRYIKNSRHNPETDLNMGAYFNEENDSMFDFVNNTNDRLVSPDRSFLMGKNENNLLMSPANIQPTITIAKPVVNPNAIQTTPQEGKPYFYKMLPSFLKQPKSTLTIIENEDYTESRNAESGTTKWMTINCLLWPGYKMSNIESLEYPIDFGKISTDQDTQTYSYWRLSVKFIGRIDCLKMVL